MSLFSVNGMTKPPAKVEKPPIKSNLEYGKLTRKFSPEADLGRAIMQSQKREKVAPKTKISINKISPSPLVSRGSKGYSSNGSRAKKQENEPNSYGFSTSMTKKQDSYINQSKSPMTGRQSNKHNVNSEY
jgi:hypothetical protein